MGCMYMEVFASRFAYSEQGYCVLQCLIKLLAIASRFDWSQCHDVYINGKIAPAEKDRTAAASLSKSISC